MPGRSACPIPTWRAERIDVRTARARTRDDPADAAFQNAPLLHEDRTMSNETIRKAVNAYFTTLSAMDADAWLAVFAEGAIGYDPGSPPLVGREGLGRYVRGLLESFKAFSVTPEAIFTCDSGAAVRWSARGTVMNGREVAFDGIEVFEVDAEGKIQWARAYWDPASLGAQMQAP
jgi:steroid Delta-isomerase